MTSNESTKTAPADVRFAVTITDGTRYPGDQTSYRHFTARAYVLGVDKYGSTGRPELLSPTDYSVPSTAKALDGLTVTAQADSDSMKRPGDEWYAWEVSYDRSRVQLKDAEEILPVLRKIDKRVARLTSELGRPSTLASFCAYVASAITRQTSVFLRRVDAEQDYEGTGYRSMDADALSYHLASDASEWRKDHGIDGAS